MIIYAMGNTWDPHARQPGTTVSGINRSGCCRDAEAVIPTIYQYSKLHRDLAREQTQGDLYAWYASRSYFKVCAFELYRQR